MNRYWIIAFLLLSWTSGLYSQQIIKFKNGKEEKVLIVHQTKDTLEYQLPSESHVTRIASMDQVDGIIDLKKDKTWLHYRHATYTGIVLASSGAFISILGIIIMVSAEHPNDYIWSDTHDATVGVWAAVTVIGVALLLPGAILAAVYSSQMKKYENKLRALSFDVKYTPEFKGISLVYRF